MADPATRDDLRELVDAVRDLIAAHAAGAASRIAAIESLRGDGQARGETVVAQIAVHHTATLSTLSELVRRIDAVERTKAGAPFALVYMLIAAIVVQGGVVLHLYGQQNGQDASAAFRDVTAAAETLSPAMPEEAGE